MLPISSAKPHYFFCIFRRFFQKNACYYPDAMLLKKIEKKFRFRLDFRHVALFRKVKSKYPQIVENKRFIIGKSFINYWI